jgi:GntR family transcriptional regulator
MTELTISRNTAKQAIEELVRDGLVERMQGKGTFIAERKVSFGLQRLSSFSEEMRHRGIAPASQVLSFESEIPSLIIAQRLHLQPGERVFRLERLRLGDGQPMAHQISYIPVKLCPGLDANDFSEHSLFSVIENSYGLILSHQEQIIRPVNATKEDALLLDVPVGVPLLQASGVAYLEDGTPIEANRILYRSDRYEFIMRSVRKPEF